MRNKRFLFGILLLVLSAFCLPQCSQGIVEGCVDDSECSGEPDLYCDLSVHRCVARPCTVDCAGRECGPDPQNCGTSCGTCTEPDQQCDPTTGRCTTESSSDVTPPLITITSPANNETVKTSAATVAGTASDDVALSKVEVKVGTGAFVPASGTATWSVVVTLAVGTNTITAKATDTSGNAVEASVVVVCETTVVKNLEAGTFGAMGWFSPIPETNDPLLTWEVNAYPDNPRAGVTTVWEDQRESWSTGKVPQTDFDWVQKQFDKATNNKDGNWTYATYLLGEELFHPSVRAQWVPSKEGLDSWVIEGSRTFAKIEIMHLKPWYIQKYGAWDQSWWDSARAANRYDDPKVLEWSVYYGYNLHQAWNQHIKNLGKKTAETGIVGIPATGPSGLSQAVSWLFPAPMWEYVMGNVDAVLAYQYPTCIDCAYKDGQRPVSASVDVVRRLREDHGYTGKIIQILTSVWPDGCGSGDQAVQWAEFQAIAPYVDVIMGAVYVFNDNGPNPSVPYAPRLVQFLKDYRTAFPGNPIAPAK